MGMGQHASGCFCAAPLRLERSGGLLVLINSLHSISQVQHSHAPKDVSLIYYTTTMLYDYAYASSRGEGIRCLSRWHLPCHCVNVHVNV